MSTGWQVVGSTRPPSRPWYDQSKDAPRRMTVDWTPEQIVNEKKAKILDALLSAGQWDLTRVPVPEEPRRWGYRLTVQSETLLDRFYAIALEDVDGTAS